MDYSMLGFICRVKRSKLYILPIYPMGNSLKQEEKLYRVAKKKLQMLPRVTCYHAVTMNYSKEQNTF